jgi:hypothetical protein
VPVVGRRVVDLPGVLATGGFDQPIQRVVGISLACVDNRVAKELGRDCIVDDVGDVPACVVREAENLQRWFTWAG